jgi:hypothetical protein
MHSRGGGRCDSFRRIRHAGSFALRGAAAEAKLRRMAARDSDLLDIGWIAWRGRGNELLQMLQCNCACFGFEGIGLGVRRAQTHAKCQKAAEPPARSGRRPTSGFRCQA